MGMQTQPKIHATSFEYLHGVGKGSEQTIRMLPAMSRPHTDKHFNVASVGYNAVFGPDDADARDICCLVCFSPNPVDCKTLRWLRK